MIGTLAEEGAAAREIAPFPDAYVTNLWMDRWCERCANDDETFCPLRDVAYFGLLPRAWTVTHSGGLADQYTCAEWTPA